MDVDKKRPVWGKKKIHSSSKGPQGKNKKQNFSADVFFWVRLFFPRGKTTKICQRALSFCKRSNTPPISRVEDSKLLWNSSIALLEVSLQMIDRVIDWWFDRLINRLTVRSATCKCQACDACKHTSLPFIFVSYVYVQYLGVYIYIQIYYTCVSLYIVVIHHPFRKHIQ